MLHDSSGFFPVTSARPPVRPCSTGSSMLIMVMVMATLSFPPARDQDYNTFHAQCKHCRPEKMASNNVTREALQK